MTNKMLPYSPKQMGESLAKFEPARKEIFTSLIVTILVTIAGLSAIIFSWRTVYLANGTLPFAAENRWSWLYVILANVFGIAFTAGGFSYLLYLQSVDSGRTEFCENGFRTGPEGSSEEILWEDVKLIRESVVFQKSPLATGVVRILAPVVAKTTFYIETYDDKSFMFDCTTVKNLQRFESFMREQAQMLSLDWIKDEHRV